MKETEEPNALARPDQKGQDNMTGLKGAMTVEAALLMIVIVMILCAVIALALGTEQGVLREAAALEAQEQQEAADRIRPQTLIRIGEALHVIFPTGEP